MQGKFPLPCQSLHTFPIKSTLTIDPFTLVDLTENLVGGGGGHRAGVTPWRTVLPTWLLSTSLYLNPFPPSLLFPFHLRSKIKSSFCLSKHFNFCPDNLSGSVTMDSDLTPTPQVKDTGLSYRHGYKFRDPRPLPLLTSWLQARGFSLPIQVQ